MRSAIRSIIPARLSVICWSALWLVALYSPMAVVAAKAEPGMRGLPQADELAEASRLNDEAIKLYNAGRYDTAVPLAVQALAIYEKVYGPQHIEVAQLLENLATFYRAKGDYAKAEPLIERQLAIYEKLRGPQHADVARALNNLAELYRTTGDNERAEPLFQRALAIDEKVSGPNHPDVARDLNNLALLYSNTGNYAKAEPLYRRALLIFEKALGPEHTDLAAALNNLAVLYWNKGDYAKAEPLLQRALLIVEKVSGPEHPDVAPTLISLAVLYYARGEYEKAEPLYRRALAIYEKVFGPEHPDVATTLNNLAELYRARGDYGKAEPLYQRALAIYEKVLGPEHANLAQSVNNLAVLYQMKGDFDKAEPLLQRALAIREKRLGPEHPDVAQSLNNLAQLYWKQRDYQKAEPLYQRALTIAERALGPEHPFVALLLNNLALLYTYKGDLEKAGPLLERALAIQEKQLGPEHPDVAQSLHNLAGLYHVKGDYAKAEPLYQRALAIAEHVLGPSHTDVARALSNLATLYETTGDLAKAIACTTRGNEARERSIMLNLAAGSERAKLLYFNSFSGETDSTISLHVMTAPGNPAALRLALLTTLRRKGRVLDATADNFAALRRRLNPQDRALFEQLSDTRSRLAGLVLGGPGANDPKQHQIDIKRLEEQADQLENEVSRRSAEFRSQSQAVTLEAVQNAIPNGAALVEFVSFRPFLIKETRFGQLRFAVYVLKHQGEPQWVDLGDAAAIDQAVENLRAVLRKDEDKPLSDVDRQVKPLARALDEKVMRPVRALLGDATHLLISPDGSLNLIPFAALVDEKNRFLVERFSLTYLTSGRDLLRLKEKLASTAAVMVFANPDFGAKTGAGTDRGLKSGPAKAVANQPATGAIDFSQVVFEPLPGTEQEARALKAILPGAKILAQGLASKAAIKQIAAPKILHIATHGFFLEDMVASATTEGRGLAVRRELPGAPDAPQMNRVENSLLRAGLAMAGANLRNGDDIGVLTALEVSGLDLWGTKLVVLSACDTGVGEIKNGQGVYGLRRALVLAGSETQVMSLWPVSDEGTRDLMIEYYKALEAGQGRGEALRQVQLRMMAGKQRHHPYFWASFIQSGEWANLDGKR
jgi:CHAT domain-containing protein/Tfp pilus assembly protein PilF